MELSRNYGHVNSGGREIKKNEGQLNSFHDS